MDDINQIIARCHVGTAWKRDLIEAEIKTLLIEVQILRADAQNMRRVIGEQGAHIEKLNAMLLVAQRAASKAIEDEAAEAISKARRTT